MNSKSKPTLRSKPVFRIGQRVNFTLVDELMHGVISEDRGPLGEDGKRIYQVEADFGSDEPRIFELAEEDLSLESEAPAVKA